MMLLYKGVCVREKRTVVRDGRRSSVESRRSSLTSQGPRSYHTKCVMQSHVLVSIPPEIFGRNKRQS